ncbi:MAG: hypothetical protein RL172_2757 [Bacteroidota bacterium]
MRKLKFAACTLVAMFIMVPAVFSQTPKEEQPAAAAEQKKVDTSIIEDAKAAILDNIPVISLDENDNQDGSAQNVSSVLSAGRDPYFNAATFHFNAVRFRFRGYDADAFSTMMNGVPMENLDNGFTPFGLWGGLNDVVRNRDAVLGLRPTPYAFGDFGGITYLDTRASKQRKQTSINYAVSNRTYDNRFMITHSTGLSKKGWALSIAGSRRWAGEGYVPGSYYDGWSGYLGVDKRINSRHLLSFVTFYTPTENGRQGSSVTEMTELAADNFYNPFWGYQVGKKRNSSVAKIKQPVFLLTHDWKANDKISITTAASYMFGNRSVSALDWYNAPDPRPDYYRYLPSYVTDPAQKEQLRQAMMNDVNLRQVNWDKLYNINYASYETIRNANGIPGNTVSGRRSRYILENRNIYTNRINLNTVMNASLASNIDFTAGGSYQYQKNHYYKTIEDLLGGIFYVDLNQFAERDFPDNPLAGQNDLNAPNRILRQGDKFGYNYAIDIQRAAVWAQSQFKFRKIDFFVAAEHSYTSFFRTGYTRVGLFPKNSYGKSDKQNFYNYSFKGGVTYKLNGRNYFYANGAYLTRAPFFDNAYIAPRTRDFVQDNLTNERIVTAEAGYVLNSPIVKFRATGFYTNVKNQMNVLTFYDDQFQNLVNYALSNIGKQHFGAELGLDVKLGMGFSFNAAANIARYYYDTRQKATVTIDNSSEVLATDVTIYSENFRVATPQESYTAGFEYRSPNFWFVNANVNYFNNLWLDFNPLRRTTAAVSGLDPKSDLYKSIVDQTKLDDQATVDVFGGYSWRVNNRVKSLKKNMFLLFNLGINNLLDNKKIVSGGFEQLRFDYEEKNVNKFPPKRFYSFGRTFFASVGLRF